MTVLGSFIQFARIIELQIIIVLKRILHCCCNKNIKEIFHQNIVLLVITNY